MQTTTLKVNHEVGLHARPASQFVKAAAAHAADIQVRNLTGQSDWVDAKSILGVLTLGVEQGHQIEIKSDGPDEVDAIADLTGLVENNFGEK
jgi:phosphotransferase system HPr (HPr) family protein